MQIQLLALGVRLPLALQPAFPIQQVSLSLQRWTCGGAYPLYCRKKDGTKTLMRVTAQSDWL